MQGRRLPDYTAGSTEHFPLLQAGEYLKVSWPADPQRFGDVAGTIEWWCCSPNGHSGNLRRHTVTENGDGTITVAPSILINDAHGELWHGYLEQGVWRAC